MRLGGRVQVEYVETQGLMPNNVKLISNLQKLQFKEHYNTKKKEGDENKTTGGICRK